MLLPVLLAAGCATPERLQPLQPNNSQAVDLTGEWSVRGDPAIIQERLNRAIRDTDGVKNNINLDRRRNRQEGQRPSSGRVRGGLVYVFFHNGEALKITQTPSAMFVSFDRAVVEEYRFGELRQITVGQAEAQRASGWDGRDYVIETLDRSGMKLTERFQLSTDGKTLTRHITFRSSKGETATVIQLFQRS